MNLTQPIVHIISTGSDSGRLNRLESRFRAAFAPLEIRCVRLGRVSSLAEAYWKYARECTSGTEVLGFVHQDAFPFVLPHEHHSIEMFGAAAPEWLRAWVDAGLSWKTQLLERMRDDECGIVGVAGAKSFCGEVAWWNESELSGAMLHLMQSGDVKLNCFGPVSDVAVVDGVMMFVRADQLRKIDRIVTTEFHGYDLELSLAMRQHGLHNSTLPLLMVHESGGDAHTSEAWRCGIEKLMTSYSQMLPVTVCKRAQNSIEWRSVSGTAEKRIPAILKRDGWKLLGSKYADELNRQLLEIKASTAEHLLLLGCGDGELLEAVLKDGSKQITCVCGVPELQNELQNKYAEYERSEVLEWITFSDREKIVKRVKSYQCDQNKMIVYNSHEIAALPELYEPLFIQASAPSSIPMQVSGRIAMVVQGGLLEQECANALRKIGYDVVETSAHTRSDVSIEGAWRWLEQLQPELVFSLNQTMSDRMGRIAEVCAFAKVPFICWYLDDPRDIASPAEQAGCGHQRFAFMWDENGIEGAYESGFSHVSLLPLASDVEKFSRGEGDASLTGRVVFVGSPRFGSAEGYFAALSQVPGIEKVIEYFEDDVLRSRRRPQEQALQTALEAVGLADRVRGEMLRRLPAFIIQSINERYRVRMLSRLTKFRPVVYGEGWEAFPQDQIEWRGRIDYNDVARVYQSDAIHVSFTNLQMRSHPNQRVFDIPLCGRAVLTDRVSKWSSLFGDECNDVVFRSEENLIQRVEQFHDSVVRKRSGEAMEARVRGFHTIQHRMQEMIEYVQRFRDR